MDRKKIALLIAAVLLSLGVVLAWLGQPARQVQRRTAQFLKTVERRNWEKVATFVADDYSDRWGHDKEFVLRESREIFRQFVFLELQSDPAPPSFEGAGATLRSPVKISGQGSPVAQFVMEKVNTLRTPFIFTWRRTGWAPWDWQLTGIDQSELEIGEARFF